MDEISKKRGRDTCDTSVTSCDQKKMVAVKWHDNRTVTLLSNCIGADPLTSVKRAPFDSECHTIQESVPKCPRDVRRDSNEHWPTWDAKLNRCKACPGGYTYVSCAKCKVMCFNKDRNCFVSFHQ
ncbi:hypothetical protein MRX96_034958 [Rhipicephalus microplus]